MINGILIGGVNMVECDLCGDESSMLYTVDNEDNPEGDEHHLCKSCLKIVHEAYVEIK